MCELLATKFALLHALFLTKEACYDVALLIFKSDTEGLCISSDAVIVRNHDHATLTNMTLTVRQEVDGTVLISCILGNVLKMGRQSIMFSAV